MPSWASKLLIHGANPVPYTYLRGIGAMPLNIHPRIQARGFCGTGQTALRRDPMHIRGYFLDWLMSDRGEQLYHDSDRSRVGFSRCANRLLFQEGIFSMAPDTPAR